MVAPNLKEIRLPAGDVAGFDIGGRGDNGTRQYDPAVWLSEGFDGVRFIGAGTGRTRIVPPPGVWTNLFIEQHPGIVQFESLTIMGRGRAALMAGRDHPTRVEPKFKLIVKDFELQAMDPSPGMRSSVKWGFFTYQCDVTLQDGTIWYLYSSEHPSYAHGFAKYGLWWERVNVEQAGAECCKVRSDPYETLWAGNKTVVVIKRCKFKNWYQEWSDRGGGGIVLQGAASDVLVENSEFWAPNRSYGHSRCVMIDDGYGDFYDRATGRVGQGFATGQVLLKSNAFRAGPGSENLSIVIRVKNLEPGHKVAKSLKIESSGIYGQNIQLEMGDIPSGKLLVTGCNTPEIKSAANAYGIDTTYEAVVPLADHMIPVSLGYAA